MKQSNKKILAKEIIIFFSTAVIAGLVLITVLIINEISSNNNIHKLQKQINQLNNESDSINILLWPKTLSLEKMIVGQIPAKYYEKQNLDRLLIDIDSTKIADVQINKLYNLLLALNYPFNGDTNWIPSEVFVENIKNEFRYDWKNRIELNKIYKFLKDKKFINISDDLFVFNLEGLLLPKSLSLLEEFENRKTHIEELQSNLKNSNSRLSDSEINDKIIFICIFFIIIIYPFRFIVLALLWAIKQLKEN